MIRTDPNDLSAQRGVHGGVCHTRRLLSRIAIGVLFAQIALFTPVALFAPVAVAQAQEAPAEAESADSPVTGDSGSEANGGSDGSTGDEAASSEGDLSRDEDASGDEEDEVSGELDDLLGVAAFGVSAGFPAYQTAALNASVQVEYVGMSLRTTWTPAAGLYGALALRGYPPVSGSPVPVFLEVGAGVHAGGAVPFAAVGAHVPLAQRIRLDVELGAARVPLLDQYNTAPFISLGVSYAFSFDVAEAFAGAGTGSGGRRVGRGVAGATNCGLPPDASELRGAVSSTVSQFLRDARASYGSLYRRLRYSYRISDREISGDSASVSVDYEGSVVEIASGETIRASGTASVNFTWNGCSWSRTGISY